jgi:Copper transport outer membrane protein, MctB
VIDFRYHVVSIVAVFLALTVGVVLGSSLFNEPIVNRLGDEAQQLREDKDALRNDLAALERTAGYNDAFSTQLAPGLVRGRLSGQRAVLVTLPGADGRLADSTGKVLAQAGAVVTGRVSLTGTWLDPEQRTVLDETVARLVPPGISFAEGADPHARAATELAAALVARRPQDTDAVYQPGAAVLAGLREGGFVEVTGAPAQRATLAVVVAAPAPERPGERAADDVAALLQVPAQLDLRARGTVLVGPVESAARGGLVSALRGDEQASRQVSSVDTVTTAAGRVATVYALEEQLAGRSGHYGVAGTTDGPLPTPSPAATS